MADEVAIKVDNVSKTFKLPHEKNTSLKSAVVSFYRRKQTFEAQQVLKDVTFEIKKGEFFGIVGRNGSGKSTLLKMLAGIYTPTEGAIHISGKLTPFIELGVGFNPELSGRENVFLNGALLGFNRTEMQSMYNDIVSFAELERFMDQKLKNYSSGMQVRLAFSIAIRAKNDILVLDEVLAVGDEAFQKKCIDIFENYKSQKQTVVLVTHDMGTVKRFCTRAMLINNGQIVSIGDPNKVASSYTELNNEVINKSIEEKAKRKAEKYTTEAKIADTNTLSYGDEIILNLDWSRVSRKVENIGVAIYGNAGEYIFGANTILDRCDIKGARNLRYTLKARLGSGNYHFKIGLFGSTDKDIIEFIDEGPEFTIKKNLKPKWEGLTYLEHKWEKQ
jgi:ABC-2 type transport system ATP-binding protein